MSTSYRDKAISGLSWTIVHQVGQQVIQFAIQMTLARLLLPAEFGLIAMMSVFIAMSSMIAQAGMGSTVIQIKKLNDKDIRTAFTLNVMMGLLMSCVLSLSAPWISRFYEQPQLTVLLRVLSISVFIQQVGGVHGYLLSRELKYKKLAIASLPGLLISGIIGVSAALRGFGVWSLIMQSISSALITSFLLWRVSDWPVRIGFFVTSFKKIFPFGWRIAANQLLNVLFNNIYIIVIGRFYLASEVAFYQRAKSFQNLAVINLMSIFNRVAFPLLSRLNAESEERAKSAHYKFLSVVGWVVIPALAVLAGLSEPLIIILLTDKWIESAAYLKILSLIGMFLAINIANANFMIAKGDAGLHLKLSIISKILVILVLCFTYHSSISAMLWGHFSTSVSVHILLLYFICKKYHVSFRQILYVLKGPVLSSILMYISAKYIVSIYNEQPFMGFVVGLLTTGSLYWLSLYSFRSSFRDDILAIKRTYPRIYLVTRILRLI